MTAKAVRTPGSSRSSWSRRCLRALLVSCVAATTAVAVAAPASAQCNVGGMGFTNINIQTINVTGSSAYYWTNTVLRSANKNWNDKGRGINLQTATSSGGKYAPGEYSGNYFGVYIASGSRRVNRTFRIDINARTIREYAPQSVKPDFEHWNRTVSVHELGHALGIEDNPNDVPSGQYSMMIYPPQSGPFYDRFNDFGYYDLPTNWDGYEAARCSAKSSVP